MREHRRGKYCDDSKRYLMNEPPHAAQVAS
jgi:hypothetical protein